MTNPILSMPIASEAQMRRWPATFRKREQMLAALKHAVTLNEARRMAEDAAAGERARAERAEGQQVRAMAKWKHGKALPDPEGPARLQQLIKEEDEHRARKRGEREP